MPQNITLVASGLTAVTGVHQFTVSASVETGSGHPGLTRFTNYPGLTRFTNYPGLTRIVSREKGNCSFDDVETYKRYRVALS